MPPSPPPPRLFTPHRPPPRLLPDVAGGGRGQGARSLELSFLKVSWVARRAPSPPGRCPGPPRKLVEAPSPAAAQQGRGPVPAAGACEGSPLQREAGRWGAERRVWRGARRAAPALALPAHQRQPRPRDPLGNSDRGGPSRHRCLFEGVPLRGPTPPSLWPACPWAGPRGSRALGCSGSLPGGMQVGLEEIWLPPVSLAPEDTEPSPIALILRVPRFGSGVCSLQQSSGSEQSVVSETRTESQDLGSQGHCCPQISEPRSWAPPGRPAIPPPPPWAPLPGGESGCLCRCPGTKSLIPPQMPTLLG